MITHETLRDLSSHDVCGAPVVSLYLDVDGAQYSSLQIAERVHSLVRQARIDVTRRDLTADDLWAVSEELDRVVRYMSDQSPSDDRKGLVIFAAASPRFWRVYDLPVPVEDRLVIGRAPFIRPLAALLDQNPSTSPAARDLEERSLLAMLTAAAAGSYGVADVDGVLRALYEGTVVTLIVDCRLSRPGSVCVRCGRLYSGQDVCPKCGSKLARREEDLFDAAIRAAYRSGARIATIRQEAAWSGMGALLRRQEERTAPRTGAERRAAASMATC